VEKPMTLDLNQAKNITEAVEKKGLVTVVGFQDRYLDTSDRIKEELKNMSVGMVYGSWIGGVPGVWWWMKKDTCGAQLVEQNIHLVDLLRYFFGEPVSVYAQFGRGLVNNNEFKGRELPSYETDDYSSAMFTFESGLTANLMSGCFVTQEGNPIRNGLTIIGRDKSLEYELRHDLRIYTSNTTLQYKRAVNQSALHDRAFLDAVKAKDPTAVRSPYGDAYKTLRMALAANESMETGKVVKL